MQSKTKVLTIQEAMDNLATIAEINLEHPTLLGIVHDTRFVTESSELAPGAVRWLSEEGEGPILDILDITYRTLHHHLEMLYYNPETDWDSKKFEEGVAAMMSLVGESAVKMDRYLAFRAGVSEEKRVEKTAHRPEFRHLQQFYLEFFVKKFSDHIEGDEAWEEEWTEASLLGTMSALKDFEVVRRDEEYELFYIRDKDGEPYFTTELLRNIKLTADLELAGEGFEEDPLLQVRSLLDRDLQASALQIMKECRSAVESFFAQGEKLQESDTARFLSMALLALMLAANPRNLLQNTDGKNCLNYFFDFIFFLQTALKTDEYQKRIAYPPAPKETLAHLLLALAHHLSFALFTHSGGVRQEVIGLIHRTMRKGEESLHKNYQGDSLWNELLIADERFRTQLSKFPSGPLFKILDLLREEEDQDVAIAFDPIHQGNFPHYLYSLQIGKKEKTSILHIPSPIYQESIERCTVVGEFHAFLRYLNKSSSNHLLINLNDRTSWREYVRSRTLENLHMRAEYSKQFTVVTLSKETDFYHQNNEYLNLHRAEDFLASFRAQLQTPEECGFYFPHSLNNEQFSHFVENAITLIHKHFFQNETTLSRRAREDFIEIFYQFLLLRIVALTSPTSLSFSSKDGLDTGSASAATFYAFLKLLHENFSEREERDFLSWLFYSQTLLVRERAVHSGPLNRSLSALQRIDEMLAKRGDALLADFAPLYPPKFLDSIRVTREKNRK
ncbi:MAG: hypothetical protein KGI80_06310 [Verrucomicrobiota bacterium]|nr:hypothetical protein [Verrucomicrobiota bacterium]